jgi:ABC-type amino acid transport substrate-binding protein
MFQLIGFLSGFINIFGYVPYIRDIKLGKTKPERMSWFIWAVLGSIAFFSQLAEGATDSLWMPGVQTVGVIIIFLLAIKRGTGGLKRSDIAALIVAVVGLALWFFTREAVWALIFVMIADSAGSLLTVIKTYKDPESETLVAWVFATLAGLLAAIAVGKIDAVLLAYPIYIFFANFSVIVAIYAGRRAMLRAS